MGWLGTEFALALICALAAGLLWWRERRRRRGLEAILAAPPRDAPLRDAQARAAAAEAGMRARAAIIEHLPDPLVQLDADGAVSSSNAAARALFGSELAAVLRHPGLREAIAAGHRATVELDLAVPVARTVQATVIPLAATPDVTTVVVLADRSRERAVERMRADFVANASHELRTPLASLIGFIDTLRGAAAEDPEAQQRFLAIMAEQGGRMTRLIDDLLSLSRVELTEHVPPLDLVDATALARSVAAGFEPRLGDGKLRLAVDLASDLPRVPGDADQLAQVLTNLIDNAAKYGGGDVRLSVAAASGGRWPARPGVVMAIADSGPGIPREHLPRLTERFYRVDKARSRGAGGTGLGLAIVRHIVNRHRGQLVIESEEGKGSTFFVWLPAIVQE